MTKARVNADNVTADIAGITAGTGITGGGTSGTVTITNDMATTIAAAGDLIYGTANDAYAALSLGTAGKVLKVNSGATAPEWAVDPTTDVVTTAGDLIYGTGADAVTRLGIGTAGQVLKVNSGATAPEWGSSGLTWTERLNAIGYDIRTIGYNGSNLYIAAGDAGSLYTSPDAITWTSRTSGFGSNTIQKVSFGNGLWVAVGGNGTITTSTDGITWTARTANMSTNEIRDVQYANSIWVAVGVGGGTTNTGGITYSTDGITWTRKSQSLTVGASYETVIWNGTNWIVGASQATNNFLYASTPSGTWTAGLVDSGTLHSIVWDGTRHTIFSSNGNGYISTSTTLATKTQIAEFGSFDGNTTHRRVNLYNGKIYAISGAYLFSFTPTSTAYARNYNIEGISPASRAQNGTPYLSINNGAIFYGAAGWIVATNSAGIIYTSF